MFSINYETGFGWSLFWLAIQLNLSLNSKYLKNHPHVDWPHRRSIKTTLWCFVCYLNNYDQFPRVFSSLYSQLRRRSWAPYKSHILKYSYYLGLEMWKSLCTWTQINTLLVLYEFLYIFFLNSNGTVFS